MIKEILILVCVLSITSCTVNNVTVFDGTLKREHIELHKLNNSTKSFEHFVNLSSFNKENCLQGSELVNLARAYVDSCSQYVPIGILHFCAGDFSNTGVKANEPNFEMINEINVITFRFSLDSACFMKYVTYPKVSFYKRFEIKDQIDSTFCW